MDIAAFTTAFSLAKQALDILRGVKDIMPESENKQRAAKLIDQADHSFRIAEAQAAKELGYMLCQCTWPPQICLGTSEQGYRCPKCGNDPYS
jgi:hypothetical protein